MLSSSCDAEAGTVVAVMDEIGENDVTKMCDGTQIAWPGQDKGGCRRSILLAPSARWRRKRGTSRRASMETRTISCGLTMTSSNFIEIGSGKHFNFVEAVHNYALRSLIYSLT